MRPFETVVFMCYIYENTVIMRSKKQYNRSINNIIPDITVWLSW